ncbi:MAG: reverse transcriptase-like protein [Sphingomonas adhaesiva]|uniref:reverse transcriptase-like protein n=1 Tax=Sphingomonas adhaesiva TaxID=28212 RepID=UPI002FF65DD5
MKLFFDGSSRPLPFGMATAVVAGGRAHLCGDLGPGTSMDAEWLALLHAVRLAYDLGIADAVLLGDAAAVIAQAKREVRCPPACRVHLATFQDLPRHGRLRLRYIRRHQNLAGIALEAVREQTRPRIV